MAQGNKPTPAGNPNLFGSGFTQVKTNTVQQSSGGGFNPQKGGKGGRSGR